MVVCLVLVLTAGTADVSRYRTPMTADGLLGEVDTEALPPLHYSVTQSFGYAHNPVTWRYEDGTYDPVLAHQAMLEIAGAVGIVRFVDVGFGLPVMLYQHGPKNTGIGNFRGSGLGDLRVIPRLQFAEEKAFRVGGAFVSEFTFPTGDSQRFTGDPYASWRPRFVLSTSLVGAHLIGSLGYHLRKNAEIADLEMGDQLEFHLGAEVEVARITDTDRPVEVLVELAGATAAAAPFSGKGLFSLEALVGGRARLLRDLVLVAGLGVGLSDGIGTPAVRGFVSAAYHPIAEDMDRDGITDSRDGCPYDPEDFDGFEDTDGCPEEDNDQDNIADEVDRCPNLPEDYNGFRDVDGCPDDDEVDTDLDGIPDLKDDCPHEGEDIDEFRDEDGCPELDNDVDGIPDAEDLCPDEKETINGITDYDGCPDEGEGLTEVVETKIEIKETILFESGKAIIKEESMGLLDQVALQILAHPDIFKVRIEGHTDNLGPDEDNLYLSQDRADAVRRYLISRGVPKEKLEAIGYGETVPIDTNDTRAGRAKNRRVEFVIMQFM